MTDQMNKRWDLERSASPAAWLAADSWKAGEVWHGDGGRHGGGAFVPRDKLPLLVSAMLPDVTGHGTGDDRQIRQDSDTQPARFELNHPRASHPGVAQAIPVGRVLNAPLACFFPGYRILVPYLSSPASNIHRAPTLRQPSAVQHIPVTSNPLRSKLPRGGRPPAVAFSTSELLLHESCIDCVESLSLSLSTITVAVDAIELSTPPSRLYDVHSTKYEYSGLYPHARRLRSPPLPPIIARISHCNSPRQQQNESQPQLTQLTDSDSSRDDLFGRDSEPRRLRLRFATSRSSPLIRNDRRIRPRILLSSELAPFPAHAPVPWAMNVNHSVPSAGASTVASTVTSATQQHSIRATNYSPPTSAANPTAGTAATASTTAATNSISQGAMATTSFLPSAQSYRNQGSMQLQYPLNVSPTHAFDREVSRPVANHFNNSPGPMVRVLIRGLPLKSDEEAVRLMVVWSNELFDVEMVPPERSEDVGFRSAILRFRTMAGARQAQEMLHDRSNVDKASKMIVEVLSSSPSSTRRNPTDPAPVDPSSNPSPRGAPSGLGGRATNLYAGAFQSIETMSSPTYPGHELPNPDDSAHYQNLFSPQSPIGNHLTDNAAASGKSLITNDFADDEETSDLLKDPVGFAENGATTQRRATEPQLPFNKMASLSLNTNSQPPSGPSSLPPLYKRYERTCRFLDERILNERLLDEWFLDERLLDEWLFNERPLDEQLLDKRPSYPRAPYPQANPADQNPPCNTLYVGNLPVETSEEELKAMFSKQRGYKRLCLRTKANGPMCFVEFEDVSTATKTLHELYGTPLHNSVKGGIRLSFSKNPLGVRSPERGNVGPSNGLNGLNSMKLGSSNNFTTASGPPPGLSAPPGLQSGRGDYHGSPVVNVGPTHGYAVGGFPNHAINNWAAQQYNPPMASPNGFRGGMPNGVPNGFSPVLNGLHSVPNGLLNGLSNGLPNGMHNSMQNGLGMHNGMSNGMQNGLPNGMQNGLLNGLHNGLSNGVPSGPSHGLHNNPQAGYPPHMLGR
ncbi:hypothetical protein G7046_g8347 [Stylonectria norvegica]|nr:hypothetical protein G7046_g8347 [Stylonectria norvegica]